MSFFSFLRKKSTGTNFNDAIAFYYKKRYDFAFPIFEHLAQQGRAESQYMLGICYFNGEGVEQNYDKAVEWYTKSAEQGDCWAQYRLGEYYEQGQNLSKATDWYSKSANGGCIPAQKWLELKKSPSTAP